MLTIQDIMGVCECDEAEIEAIAMHEQVPDVIASEMAEYMLHAPNGLPTIRDIIIDDIVIAREAGHADQAEKLCGVLKHFIATHPEYQLDKLST